MSQQDTCRSAAGDTSPSTGELKTPEIRPHKIQEQLEKGKAIS